MTEVMYGAVCEKRHIRSRGRDYQDLDDDQYCPRCGKSIIRVCPQCENLIPIRKKKRDEDSYYWDVPDYCTQCGNSYPWGPSRFDEIANKVGRSLSSNHPQPSGVVFTSSLEETLEDTKYGSEILSHVREGDQCYRNRLWHSSLTMYIHAYEWAAITFLEESADVDVIEKEKEGVYYNLAGGRNSLLDELMDNIEIDQKTSSKITSMNRAERRWMAHHKSGETLRDEVDAVRARLAKFIQTLFNTDGG